MVAILKKNNLYQKMSFISFNQFPLLNTLSLLTYVSIFYMLANVSDSGSNNFTLECEMHQQLYKEGLQSGHNFGWKPKLMSVRCFCHKMGLIVKAGLDALGMKPLRVRHSGLGRFPAIEALAVIEEEDKAESNSQDIDSDDGADLDGADLESNDSSNADDDETSSIVDPDEEDNEQHDEPQIYRNRKKAYLLGDTYMKQLTKDVTFFFLLSLMDLII